MSAGILGTRAGLVADVNLILQIFILIVLTIGAFQAKKRNFDTHCTLMTTAVIANAVLIIAIMNPSFFRILPFALRNPGAPRPTVLWPHVIMGTIAELMGVYIVIRMKAEASGASRPRHIRQIMGITFSLWVVALVIGIALYFVWYV